VPWKVCNDRLVMVQPLPIILAPRSSCVASNMRQLQTRSRWQITKALARSVCGLALSVERIPGPTTVTG
jgi:hypothetical protein